MPGRHCGLRYRGINILILWAEAETRGFRSPFWMTFKQALEYGACVRKGERGTGIVYANRVTRTEAGENGEDVERSFSFLKGYTVFNADQIDGLPDRFLPQVPQAQQSMAWDDYADALAWSRRSLPRCATARLCRPISQAKTGSNCRRVRASAAPWPISPREPTKPSTGLRLRAG
jgi:hypothetical protein